MTLLHEKLRLALEAREKREIRRQLPEPEQSAADTAGITPNLIDFVSNDYLSLSTSPRLRRDFLARLRAQPKVLGSGGSRLLVNGSAHSALENRLKEFFGAPAALLFNSGFDANVGLFSCLPQPGDVVVYDEYIHASVHDGLRASRVRENVVPFKHNCLESFHDVLSRLVSTNATLAAAQNSIFVAVESLYSMDGTIAPLRDMVELAEMFFPRGNCFFIVDEAHATGLYGPQGKGLVSLFGLEDRIFARLHTFGKALAGSGAAVLVTPLVKNYLLNYARTLIYTTSLNYASIIANECSFDLLEDGTTEELSRHLHGLSAHLQSILCPLLRDIPPTILSLPSHLTVNTSPARQLFSPIIPFLTSQPRALSSYLYQHGMNARPITWPTVPKGTERVRVCLHAGHSKSDVERLVLVSIRWALEQQSLDVPKIGDTVSSKM